MSARKKATEAVKSPPRPDWTPSHWISLPALAVLTLLVYANSLHGQFVFDDLSIVLQNSTLMNVKTLRDALSPATGGGWRQLLFITYALNYYWGGLNTFGYHLVNVTFHVINVWIVYGILLCMLRDTDRPRYLALFGAAVFSVHTLLSGAVSYIAGRSSVLCATFYFGAIYLFFSALNAERRQKQIILFGLTALAAALAWGAKQEAITLPVFLAAVLVLRKQKIDWRWVGALIVIPVIPFVLFWDRVKALYLVVENNGVLVSAGFGKPLPPPAYFRTYVTAVAEYFLPRFVFPSGLSVDPEIASVEHWYSPEFLLGIGVLGGLVWIAVRLHRREPFLALGITALLASPLLAYAAMPLPDVVQEHRAYIPGLGMALVFVGVFDWIRRRYFSLRWLAPVAVVLIFGLMTVSRNSVFASNVALWEDAVAKAPQKPRPHFNLGQAYQDLQRVPDAVREYEQSLALKPDIYAAYSNLAALYLDQRQFDKGEEMLLKVTSMSPNFTEGFINLGVLYIRRQQPDKALVAIDRALQINPDSFAAHFNKGEVLTMRGDYKGAVESYKAAVHLRPDLDAFKLTLGTAYVRAGDSVSAEKQFQDLTNSSVAAEAYRNLGVLYNNAGQPDQAIRYFDQAVRLKEVFPDVHQDLGVAYLRKQMPDEAIQQFRTVLEQQAGYAPAVLNLAAAYQMKGDIAAAREALEGYIRQYGSSDAPYMNQIRERLLALK